MFDITPSNRNQVCTQVIMVTSYCIKSSSDNIAEHYDLNRFQFPAEHLEFIDSVLEDIKYLYHVAEHLEGGVRGSNAMHRVSNAVNKWAASTLIPGKHNPVVRLH
jgi:hypothetical protein